MESITVEQKTRTTIEFVKYKSDLGPVIHIKQPCLRGEDVITVEVDKAKAFIDAFIRAVGSNG